MSSDSVTGTKAVLVFMVSSLRICMMGQVGDRYMKSGGRTPACGVE
jgi:hypothetical protein